MKKQYIDDGKTLWQYMIQDGQCSCECNVFHHEYDGKNIHVKCNACNETFAMIRPEYVEEELSKGVWK